jgi:hypothetical protein
MHFLGRDWDGEDLERAVYGLIGLALVAYWTRLRSLPGYRSKEKAQFRLLGLCLKVLRQDKETVFFGLAAAALALLSLAALFYIFFFAGSLGTVMGWLAGAALVTVFYFFGTLLNAAVLACCLKRLKGEKPSIAYGLETVRERFLVLGRWAMLSNPAAAALASAAGRPKDNRPLSAMASRVRHAASLFVLPVVLVEDRGLRAALARSQELARNNKPVDAALEALEGSISTLILSFLMGGYLLAALSMFWFIEPDLPQPHYGSTAVVTAAFVIPFIIALILAAAATNLFLIFTSAVFLHITGPDSVRAEVERHFPKAVLERPISIPGQTGYLLDD